MSPNFWEYIGLNRQFLVSFLSLVSGSTGQWRPQLQTLLLLASSASSRISGFPVPGWDQSRGRKWRGRWRHPGERQVVAERRPAADVRFRRLHLVNLKIGREKKSDCDKVGSEHVEFLLCQLFNFDRIGPIVANLNRKIRFYNFIGLLWGIWKYQQSRNLPLLHKTCKNV